MKKLLLLQYQQQQLPQQEAERSKRNGL